MQESREAHAAAFLLRYTACMDPVPLPPLPKKRVKREASVTPAVMEFMHNYTKVSCAIEVKATAGNTIPKSAVASHQGLALNDASTSVGMRHKIADDGHRKPFDGFILKKAPAYVVACFTKQGMCIVVPIEKWEGMDIRNVGTGYEVAFKIEK